MKVLFFDCFSGISGDMTVGSLIDLMVPPEVIIQAVESLGLAELSVSCEPVTKMGIHAARFRVLDNSGNSHHHRGTREITEIIRKAAISDNAAVIALNIMNIIAQAEGKVHGISPDQVHFHEVGALDSIADIICTAVAADYIGAERIICSPVNTGEGMVKGAHGKMPVPAPATAEILTGISCYSDGTRFELTTPTGAAIVKALCSETGSRPSGKILKTGYGAGSRDLEDRANVLRTFLIDTGDKESDVFQIETQIDDMTSETLAPIIGSLLQEGALDAWFTQILMKKQRPAVLLSVLADAGQKENLIRFILKNTTTFGCRFWKTDRVILERSFGEVQTKWGKIRTKTGIFGDIEKTLPEFEDCRKIADRADVPLWKVYFAATSKLEK
jgi:pyridinium-3,5-bisthiocarboxylic acid mononucleotide nickel chelatase